ncbi:OLC1v1012866C1 [Oldenlandia corymbosa var. corymbosa]|uniref:OLC1v1012866C1 n=1 Tax=Oldenlandia corymbosa var. corymbosa TaxID=529605 RepID=A0AAV1DWW5_OLDCO|nr:OLC1v1012866C1 [Oldenlandia corymbosa var. corymbosa]
MENSVDGNEIEAPNNLTIGGTLRFLMAKTNVEQSKKQVISLAIGDPARFGFNIDVAAQEAVLDSLLSGIFNGYFPTSGLPQARKAIADYLSSDLPYNSSPDYVYITSGCTQAIDMVISVLARPGSNFLLPRPGFHTYEICSSFRNIEARYYDLLPDNGWEVNLETVESVTDLNTVAMVVINPGNPCGSVYSHGHLEEIAEMAGRLRIPVIADEVFGHLAFGATPFVPMGVFGSKARIFTLGSSKRWFVPGWRLGWLVMNDPSGEFRDPKLQTAEAGFLADTNKMLMRTSNLCYDKLKEIPSVGCSFKPEGSVAFMVKLNLSVLEDMGDDKEFCLKLAKEESLIILPGFAVGLNNWIKIAFAAEPLSIEGLRRLKAFCLRHSKQQINAA